MSMNLASVLRRALALYPEREAAVDGGVRLTYRQLGERVFKLIGGLTSCGVGAGGMVAIISPNNHQYMEAYFACALMRAVLVPVNFRLAPHEISFILADCQARTLLAHDDFAAVVKATQFDELNSVVWIGGRNQPGRCASFEYEEFLSSHDGTAPQLAEPETDDLAQLYYTSGTTGSAKGVMLTHGNVAFHAVSAIADIGLSDADTWAHIAPMFHLADAWATFAATWVGARHVFVPYFHAEQVLSVIERERVTITNLVPTMLNAMLHQPDVHNHDYSNLRLLLSGGAPIAPETVRKIVTTFGCDYMQTYGMTETSPYLTISKLKSHLEALPPEAQLAIKSRTGRPFLGVDLKVVRPDGSEVARDDAEVGEIIVRGPTVTPGYWRQPQATAEAIKDGWLYTADLAVVDSEGYVNIVDRKKDMILTGGENVYSTEVEHVLHEHHAVLECAVFAAPDDEWGEVVHAAVVRKPSFETTELELIRFVRERLAGYKTPRAIHFLDQLPKTGSGKITKRALKEHFAAEQIRDV